MAWSADDIPDQRGRVALVTGANSGLGFETARALCRKGAVVLLACRDPERAERACRQLATEGRGTPEVLSLDLADLRSVRAASTDVQRRHGHLDLLINNAGVMALPRQLSVDGLERQFATNHLGHFALTLALLPLLRMRPGSRVVTVTSGAQHFGRIAFEDLQGERHYDRWRAYAQSKLANTMFALELQQRLDGSGTLSLAAHPGVARTQLQPSSVAASGTRLEGMAYRLMDPLFQSAAAGALPQLFAATAAGLTGGELVAPGGPGELRGAPGRGRLPAVALRPEPRARLWRISEELCGHA
ncbi:MAG: oxidoreductase [Cyanobium sp.]